MYLECTCSQISIEKWKQKMKNSRPLNYGWLVRQIKKQLPLLYKELCLEFYNPWENQCRESRLLHSRSFSNRVFYQKRVNIRKIKI